jgi:hypothetical protein
MAKFKVTIAERTELSLKNIETKEVLGAFKRIGCGCNECGLQVVLEIGTCDEIQEALYEAVRHEPELKDGDEFEYGERVWVKHGRHVLLTADIAEFRAAHLAVAS